MVDPSTRLHRLGPTSGLSESQLPSGPLKNFAVEADLPGDQAVSLAVALVVALGGVAGVGLVGGLWQLLSSLTVVVGAIGFGFARLSGRRMRRLVASLPDLIDMLARSLRSGASLAQALREASVEASPVAAQELRSIIDDLDLGQSSRHVLRSWAERTPSVEVRIVAAALAVASENETGTSQALAGVSQSLRDRRALAAEIRSHTAQASASMQAMVWLPVGLLVLDAAGDQGRLRYLTSQPLGRACLVASLVLTAIGWLWMRTIVRRRLPA